ncbi:SapC family protein [Sphingomonas sp. HT-1]|uniref:SapC family protein n=1 Tax=unclassified Sphingomonas TaxID=196159 RepID=UPI0002E9C1C1|nr:MULTISPECIES: SapC family protein [unclassified Sphingomonas]KTF69492.1 peptide ABC transporter permease [Sphingomonas sp. WG]
MTRPVALDNVLHQDLRVAFRYGAAFGDAANQLLIFPTEFEAAQREFPILFREEPQEGLQAVVLTGLDRDENLFFDGQRWTSRYVPALQQRGPFSIGIPGDGADPDEGPTVHIDLDDPRVGVDDGEPLFLPQGGASPYLEHVSKVLGRIHAGLGAAAPVYALFRELDLLEANAIEVTLHGGRRYVIEGFQMLSRERLDALPVADLDRLRQAGLLGQAYMVASSIGNISALIERKNAQAADR